MALAIVAGVAAASSRTVPGHAASHTSPRPVAFAPGAPGAAAPFDVQAIVRRAHFAFREENGRFTGGHSTYEVESESGRLSVRPVQREQAKVKVGAPLVLATSIRRGAAAVPIAESSVVDGDGRLVRGGPAVQQILENKDGGVELSWRLAEAPSGDGDLEVRLSASGLAYVDETEGGLHFRDGASPVGLRFGHATWIDADGRRTDVRSRWNGREIVMQVPRDVLDTASYPAVLDPLLGPETAVDSPVFGAASGQQATATVAYQASSGMSFVAWADSRASLGYQAFGTRVTSAGVVLDPSGIALSMLSDGNANEPVAVYDGTNFLVVYLSYPNILGRRVTPLGALLDPAPFVVNNEPHQKFALAAASDGTTTLVVWQDVRNSATTGSDLYAARVQGSTVLDGTGAGFAVSTAAGEQNAPKVTQGQGKFFVAWTDYRTVTNADIYGARVTPAGVVVDATGIAISTVVGTKGTPWTTSDGTGYLVVWDDLRGPSYDIYGARVTAGGVVADPGGFAICVDANAQTKPSAAFAGGNYQVVWEDGRFGLYGNRVVPSTAALLDGPSGAAFAGFGSLATQPRVFGAGAAFYLVWEARPNNDSFGDLFGSRLSTAASLLDAPGVTLASSANGEFFPAVAADGTNYFVAWKDDRGSTTNVFGVRVSGTTGASLDSPAILLSPGGLSKEAPAVAFNGTQYLVVWKESGPPSGIYGTRVSTAGAIVGTARTALFTGAPNQPSQDLAIASDGVGWLVVWTDTRNFGANFFDIYGGRVTAAGVGSDPSGIPISAIPQFQSNASVAYGGGNYFVTWVDFRSGSRNDLYGARVTSAGTVLDAAGLPLSVGSGSANVESSTHALAYAAPNFMAAYTRAQALSRVRITAATGAVVDEAVLGTCCSAGAAATYDFDTFLILYDIYAGGGGYLVRGTRVSTAGVDLDPTDWTVAMSTNYKLSLAALGSTGKAVVAYSRYDSTSGITSDRARTRLLTRAQSDLGVTKTDGQTTAVPGGTVTYTMTVSNAGPDAAIGATVTDTVPGTLSSVTWTCVGAGGGVCPASGTGNIAHTVDVPSGGSVTYTLAGTISSSATGSLANTITVTAPAGWTEPNTANNSATDTDTLTPQANLAITKTDGQATTTPGAGIVYTIVASNAGPSAVTGATVADTLPVGTTGASWTCSGSGGGTCTANGSGNISQAVNLPVGGSVTFTLMANVSPTASGTYSNTATVAAPGGVTDPAPGNNSATDTDTVFPPNNTAALAKPVLIGSTSSDFIGAAPSDQNWFRFGVRAGRSYCVEVDNGKSDTSQRDSILDVYRGDGTTLFRTNDDIGSEPGAGLLSRVCYIAIASEDNFALVRAGANGSWGGIRVRVVETTLFCPWFGPLGSGSGFETFILIRNTTDTAHGATVTLTGPGGAVMGSEQNGLAPANGSFNLQVSSDFGLSGVSGGLWIAHDAPPGGLIANVTTLNFGSGVSYDTPTAPRLDSRP